MSGESVLNAPSSVSSGVASSTHVISDKGKIYENTRSLLQGSLQRNGKTHLHNVGSEEPLEIQCGEKSALLFVSKLCQGSKGPCILYDNDWLTPNELQYICGRETAKDWKRSIRHKGKSLKSLIAQGFLKVHPPICDCPGCRVSSPVNRTRLADKCGFSKLPSYLTDKSMADRFPSMWRQNSTSTTSSDEIEHVKSENQDEESLPQRSHSDEPRVYTAVDHINSVRRPRSSSPDLERNRVNTKRRRMSETTAENHAENSRKHDVIGVDVKRSSEVQSFHDPLRRDLPVLTLPSSVYSANTLYGHSQHHMALHRHVTSPRLLSPSFVRASVASPAQMRVLRDQAVVSSRIYAQHLRQDFGAMPTVFPFTFTHPLPGKQILASHFKPYTLQESENEQEEKVPADEKEKREECEVDILENNSLNNETMTKPVAIGNKSRCSSNENSKFCIEEEGRTSNGRVCSDIVAVGWSIEEVCKFVSSVIGSTEYCDMFREQEIDGQALILLTEDHLSNKMGMKLGPALKLKLKIDELRCVYSK